MSDDATTWYVAVCDDCERVVSVGRMVAKESVAGMQARTHDRLEHQSATQTYAKAHVESFEAEKRGTRFPARRPNYEELVADARSEPEVPA